MFNLNIERVCIFLMGLSFFIGTWHAFPMLNVINDEMYYVGGVLRALENHTIVPMENDVPYGTLTYLANYFFSIISISALLPFFGLSLGELKIFLVQSPSIMYLSLRLLSSLFSLALLYFVNKILQKEFEDYKTRVFLLILLFTNIITTVILHTGKMWVLSTLLVIVSFYYLYKSLNHDYGKDEKILNENIFYSIFFSFLALSNFPLNFYSLISIPILGFYFRTDRKLLKKIFAYTILGIFVYVCITLFNFESIRNQIISIFSEYHPIIGDTPTELNFFSSFYAYFIKLLSLFPLLILTLLFSIYDGIRNKKLFTISSVYFWCYFFVIVLVANWTTDFRSSLRYLFPLGFFLLFMISSFNIKFKKIYFALGGLSLFFGLITIYFLSVPTTYNEAYKWINSELSSKKVVILNEVPELQLIKNKDSALYTQDKFCASKCRNIISHDLNSGFSPIVIDLTSKDDARSKTVGDFYYIKETISNDTSLELVKSFSNPSEFYHSVDYNLGNYFDLDYIRIRNLGKDIYIYKKI